MKKNMARIGFREVHYHTGQHDEGDVPIDSIWIGFRSKYISTLALLGEDTFQKGLKIFEQKAQRKYGSCVRRI